MYSIHSLPVSIPEPFRAAVSQGNFVEVCDVEPDPCTPEARYGRALARIAVGREAEARRDLESTLDQLGDACRIELVFLDLRQRGALGEALNAAREIAERAGGNARLSARAFHLLGLAEAKLRNNHEAVETLLRARSEYNALGDHWGRAAVLDTLGTVEAARGRLDHAVNFYSLALVDKVLVGDRQGMALTLGNLGRIHLRAGRFQEAIECFERDWQIAVELGDLRGQGRMKNDLGRAYLGLGDYARAEEELEACLELARRCGYGDLQFYAHKDVALLRMAQGRLEQAQQELGLAESQLPPRAEPYLRVLLEVVQGELWEMQRDPRASEALQKAVSDLERAELPDFEIPARIAWARALVRQGRPAQAERCLLRGVQLARRDGYARFLPALNQAMECLELVEGIIDEPPRRLEPARTETSYYLRERLGGGGFGEVFRAYDPERNREVARKHLRLNELYNPKRRQHVLASARAELEAASRIRHPGVVRVLAMGREADGGAYVIQEFIPGPTLRRVMSAKESKAPLDAVLACLQRLAESLQAMHEANVIHRDLKPENVILRDGQYPTLVDFGLAHLPDKLGDDESWVAGTCDYMAPEQARGDRLDGRADLYALGVIAYEWLTGLKPLRLKGKPWSRVLQEITARCPAPVTDFRPDLPPELAELIMALLSKRARKRPGTAAEVAVCLQAVALKCTSSSHESTGGWRSPGNP